MDAHEFLTLLLGSGLAGFFASMLGLGGGFILVPMLALFFHLPIHTAVGTSLLCIIATSQSFALAKPAVGYTKVKNGIFLETFTLGGVIIGGTIAASVNARVLETVFGAALSVVFVLMLKKVLSGKSYADEENNRRVVSESVKRDLFLGSLGSFTGGVISSMLGVGGGVIKVPVLRLIMKMPFREAAATSNFMIGITAAAGASFYFIRGYVNVLFAFPCILGVVAGAFLGGNVGLKIKPRLLEAIFVLVVGYFAVKMFLAGLS